MCFFLSVRAGKNKCRELCVSQSGKKQALSQNRASQPWGHPGQLSRAGAPVSPVVPGRSSDCIPWVMKLQDGPQKLWYNTSKETHIFNNADRSGQYITVTTDYATLAKQDVNSSHVRGRIQCCKTENLPKGHGLKKSCRSNTESLIIKRKLRI